MTLSQVLSAHFGKFLFYVLAVSFFFLIQKSDQQDLLLGRQPSWWTGNPVFGIRSIGLKRFGWAWFFPRACVVLDIVFARSHNAHAWSGEKITDSSKRFKSITNFLFLLLIFALLLFSMPNVSLWCNCCIFLCFSLFLVFSVLEGYCVFVHILFLLIQNFDTTGGKFKRARPADRSRMGYGRHRCWWVFIIFLFMLLCDFFSFLAHLIFFLGEAQLTCALQFT